MVAKNHYLPSIASIPLTYPIMFEIILIRYPNRFRTRKTVNNLEKFQVKNTRPRFYSLTADVRKDIGNLFSLTLDNRERRG